MYLRQIILRHLGALLGFIVEKAFGRQVLSLEESQWHLIGHSGCLNFLIDDKPRETSEGGFGGGGERERE
jgi:hypothetical protein